jgi:hypothetical protein
VDPIPGVFEVLRFDAGGYRIVGAWHGDAVAHAEPFDAHALHLAGLSAA